MPIFLPWVREGLCRFVRAAEYSSKSKENYIKDANANLSLIFQIEGETGVNNIDEILEELPQNSSIFIGPYDLSQSLGIPGQIWNSKVTDKMKSILDKCKKNNIKIGTFTDTYDGISYWTKLGVDFIEYASDLNVFIQGFRSANSVMNDVIKNKYLKL